MPVVCRDIISVLVAYLVGGIPFSHIVSRLAGDVDIRERGEGNVGARNVYHVVGHAWGSAAAILDLAKGVVVYFLAREFTATTVAFLSCGVAVGLGHNFSPFLRFHGGKGLSVTFGFLMCYLPWSSLAGILAIVACYTVTRDINKALVVGTPLVIALPPMFGKPWWTVPYAAALFLLLAVKKAIDRPHEQAVWARDPWREGVPGFHAETLAEPGTVGGEETTQP